MGAAIRYCLIVGVVAVVAGDPVRRCPRRVRPSQAAAGGRSRHPLPQRPTDGRRVPRRRRPHWRPHHHQLSGRNSPGRFADPRFAFTFWDRQTVREIGRVPRTRASDTSTSMPDLCPNRTDPAARPRVIDEFLALMDDPANRPVLLHCKAGLHRTGVLVAVYRMEYDGWDPSAAVAELKANGFGDVACTAANDYIQQYILNYRARRS